jgi:hypothetical protein
LMRPHSNSPVAVLKACNIETQYATFISQLSTIGVFSSRIADSNDPSYDSGR